MRTLFVTNRGNGSDSNPGTLDKPLATLQKAADLSRSGDEICLRKGGVFDGGVGIKGKSDLTIQAWGLGAPPIVHFDTAVTNGLALNSCDRIMISDLVLTGTYLPDKQPSGSGLNLFQCNSVTVQNCQISGGISGIFAQGNAAKGFRLLDSLVYDNYAIQLPSGQLPHSQGLFMQGQVAPEVRGCCFIRNGWTPKIPGSANMFNHAIYHRVDGGATPMLCDNSIFLLNANSGPTMEAGGKITNCFLWANGQSANSPEGWAGGQQKDTDDEISNNVCYRSLTGGLRLDSYRGSMTNNLAAFGSGTGFLVDIPHGKPNPRDSKAVVSVSGNRAVGWSGPIADVTPAAKSSGTIQIRDNQAADALSLFPVEDMLRARRWGTTMDDLVATILADWVWFRAAISANDLNVVVRQAAKI